MALAGSYQVSTPSLNQETEMMRFKPIAWRVSNGYLSLTHLVHEDRVLCNAVNKVKLEAIKKKETFTVGSGDCVRCKRRGFALQKGVNLERY